VKVGKKAIVLVGLPLGIGIAMAVVVLVILKPFDPVPAVPDPAAGEHGVLLPLDTKVVNLAPGGDFKYAKVGVTLELRPATAAFYTMAAPDREAATALVVTDMADYLPMLDDAVAAVVSAKTSSDLLNDTGRQSLKEELLDACRAVLDGTATASAPAASGASPAPSPAAAPSEVLDLYFTDLVMQ
jgi:flagellar basal body-associated protein FliL